MDHRKAVASNASDRYLLGEMSEPERFAFEAHYFECPECAAEVRAGEALARGVRAVYAEDASRRPWVRKPVDRPTSDRFAWLRIPSFIPAAIALALVSVVSYQSLVTIPGLRSSRALTPIVLRAAARGEEQTLQLASGQPYSVLSLDVNAADPGTPLVYEVSTADQRVHARGSAAAPPAGSSLFVVVSNSDLDQPGAWSLVLRTVRGDEIARYPFQLRLK